ncbi:MAG: hypothetical protein IM598_06860 [Chitinophagaceae bacterium]|nr:hypothetical protein [Chitinophagaceae bacterium]MCA6464530.1 hypothetical protein [Chitinophagaceae bacterium]
MNGEIKSITFFFPYPYISGIPVLFSNVANFLTKQTTLEVNIIDYKGGALIRSCNFCKQLRFIEFRDFEPCVLDFDTCLVLQAGIPYKLRNELVIGKEVKIIQWAAHEFNLVPFISKFNYFRKLQEQYVWIYSLFCFFNRNKYQMLSDWTAKMIDRGAIVFMTQCIYEITQGYLKFPDSLNITYVPNLGDGITTYDENLIRQKSEEVKETLELAWVGRIADFKIHILNYSILSLSRLALQKRRKIHFHIIGEGEFMHLLELHCEHEFFKITCVGKLEKSAVDIYLKEKIHCLFSMGTSALDGARIGLPVVLLDQSYLPIKKDYTFRYLQNATGYDLGHPVTKQDFEPNNNSLTEIIDEVVYRYQAVSNDCLIYYNQNHQIGTVVKKLLKQFEDSFYRIEEVPEPLLKQGMFRKCYLWYKRNVKKSYY